MWVCKCRSNKTSTHNRQFYLLGGKKATFSSQPLSCTSQGYCSSQMGLAAHSPRLHSYLQRLVSSRCKPHAPAPQKQPGSSRRLHQEDRLAKCYYQSQMSRSFPSHLLNLSSFPFMLTLSLFLLSVHSLLSVPLAQSQSLSLTCCRSPSSLFLMRPTSLSLLRFSQTPFRLSRGTSVRVTCNHHQSRYHSEDVRRSTESICLAPAFKRVTVRVMETESNKVTLPLTWFIDGIITERQRRLSLDSSSLDPKISLFSNIKSSKLWRDPRHVQQFTPKSKIHIVPLTRSEFMIYIVLVRVLKISAK